MAHEYSVLIHDWINHKIQTINQRAEKHPEDSDQAQFCKGQLSALNEIRTYLTDKIDLKTHRYY